MKQDLIETQNVVVGDLYSWNASNLHVKNGKIVYAQWNHSGLYYDMNEALHSRENFQNSSLKALECCIEDMFGSDYSEFCLMIKSLDKNSLGYSISKTLITKKLQSLQEEIDKLKTLI